MKQVAGGLIMFCVCRGVVAIEPATDPAASAPAETVGTTIYGDHEQALGLYLMPWKEEAASDIDRPPRLLQLSPKLGSAEAAESRAMLHDSINAFRHAQVGRR